MLQVPSTRQGWWLSTSAGKQAVCTSAFLSQPQGQGTIFPTALALRFSGGTAGKGLLIKWIKHTIAHFASRLGGLARQ